MALTIVLAATVAVLAIAGLLRGVRRGLLALAGTLLAAVVVDLWSERLSSWLRETVGPERPALPTFSLVAVLFVLTALIVGYGGSALLPKPDANAKRPAAAIDALLGALLGALNGTLIVSYLLRYAQEFWRDDTVTDLVAASPVGPVLEQWLPWFVMAMVGATTLFVLIRLLAAIARSSSAPKPVSPQPSAPTTGTTTASTQSQSAQNQGTQPRTVAEQDKRVMEKINQVQGKK
jgi:uncharacterized membrane protein required for colicin V production